MPASGELVNVRTEGDVIYVEFTIRNILEEASIQQIGERINAVVDQALAPKLLISFRNVEHLSSAALGMLITVHNRIRQRGGQLRLADINEQIYEVFVITKLEQLFQIYGSSQEAARSFK